MSEFERRKEYLIRSLFHDSPDLSTIQEEFYESSTTASPPLSLESHRLYSPCPPPAHCDGLWSPLPPLTIEIVKTPNKHDEPEEFYKRLHKKILKIYKRIFFEDRSDISDINTSDDDDDTQTEPIDYSAKSVELIELTHQSGNDTSYDDNTLNNNEPIDYSTSRVELVESMSQSLNNITADHENVASTEHQQSNEEIEQVDEPLGDENPNESLDYNDVENNYCYFRNLETIFECDEGDLTHLEDNKDNSNLEANVESDEGNLPNVEYDDGDIPNLEANIESDEGCVSSITDVFPNSTESDGSRESVTPLSSTVILSRGTSDEEVCLKSNEVSANATHHIQPKAQDIEEGRTSPRVTTISIPRPEAHPKKDEDMEIYMETAVSASAILHFGPEADEMDANTRSSIRTIPRAEVNSNEDENIELALEADREDKEENGSPEHHEITPGPHEGTHKDYMGDNASIEADPDNSLQSEVEEMRTPRPHRSTGSPTFYQNKRHSNEPKTILDKHSHASMYSERSHEKEMPIRPNTMEIPENLDLFDFIRISSPKDITEGNTRIIDPEEFIANTSSEDNSDIRDIDIASEDDARDICLEDNSRDNSLERNNRKRKNVSPCLSKGKKVRFADKSVQTDDLIGTKIVQNIHINIDSKDNDYKKMQIDHFYKTIVQNIKININPSIA